MEFTILDPNTPDNDSDQWRLVAVPEYVKFLNGASSSYGFTAWNTKQGADTALAIALQNPVATGWTA